MNESPRLAEVVLACPDLAPSLRYFTEELGFRLEAIFPADAPRTAVLSGHGLRLRLDPEPGPPGRLRIACQKSHGLPRTERAPNGTEIELVDADAPLDLPPTRATFAITRAGGDHGFGEGRAGMLYRDLIPDRMGGRTIASHIRIPRGGTVPDSVHFHRVQFQMIYCVAGWVRVVYEGAGPPFVLEPGDCVLQPPGIRHRVLECSDGLEVVEVGGPAEHETHLDHELSLPQEERMPGRRFAGQAFVRHVAAEAAWTPDGPGIEARDLGLATASGGLASGRVFRGGGPDGGLDLHLDTAAFCFVLAGDSTLLRRSERLALATADSFVVPAADSVRWEPRRGAELLLITLPAD